MKTKFKYILPVISLLLISYLSLNYSAKSPPIKININNNPKAFVVLELFTSQSCSSCPIADAHLAKLVKEIDAKDLQIYPLAFHVDYWNHLDWVDSYSDGKYSERQYQYARSFSKMNVYTPQVVINGYKEFVGSDIEGYKKAIATELQANISSNVYLDANFTILNENIRVQYNVDSSFTGVVNIALIQKEGFVSIKAGENEGKNVTYINIVRRFVQNNCRNKPHGQITFKKPKGVLPDNLKVFVYLQNKVNMQIVNATEATLL